MMAKWFTVLAAMAMLSARTWIQVPPTTSGVFCCNKISPLNNPIPTLTSVPCAPVN